MRGRVAWIGLGAALALSLVLGARLLIDDAAPLAEAAAPARDGLARALEVETRERRRLAREVAALREEVLRLSVMLGYAELEAAAPPVAAEPVEPVEPAEPEPAQEPEAGEAGAGDGEGGALAAGAFFDEQLLIERGVEPGEAARLREAFEEAELERLYLMDRAAREGWRFEPRMLGELADLADGLRAELGDEAYDNVLFAAGRRNRVTVADLLGRSPASRAGVEVGDVIVRYDEKPVFHARDLRRATSEGRAGAPTRVEVLRDGRRVTLSVPRGPLGVRLVPTRSEPAS